jgi:glycosyltransferase involved in cell wall biosynthesis
MSYPQLRGAVSFRPARLYRLGEAEPFPALDAGTRKRLPVVDPVIGEAGWEPVGRSAPRKTKISVVIPVYNERETIEEALRRVQALDLDLEIVVVDDCSTDGTRELLRSYPGIRLAEHARNQGKGAAIRTAIRHLTGDIVIIQDADLEYAPEEYPALIAPILAGKARVVYGSRFLRGRPRMRMANYLCNRLLALATNLLFGARITDEATCYKVFDAALLKEVPLTCRRFEFCPEVTAKILRRGERIVEVPISYTARTMDAGKKIRWWDGIEAIWTLIKFRFRK